MESMMGMDQLRRPVAKDFEQRQGFEAAGGLDFNLEAPVLKPPPPALGGHGVSRDRRKRRRGQDHDPGRGLQEGTSPKEVRRTPASRTARRNEGERSASSSRSRSIVENPEKGPPPD